MYAHKESHMAKYRKVGDIWEPIPEEPVSIVGAIIGFLILLAMMKGCM